MTQTVNTGETLKNPGADQTSRPAPKRVLPWWLVKRNWVPRIVSRKIFGGPLAPTSSEWYQIKRSLYQGDPEMDDLVTWLFERHPKERKELFEQALTRGLHTLHDPPEPICRFFHHIEQAPEWVDMPLVEHGARSSHIFGETAFYLLRDMALMGGYAYFNSMNQTLARSGSLHQYTARRLGETGKWLIDVTEPGGLQRYGEGFINTIRVRMIHGLVRRHLQTKKEWDAGTYGLPINQIDMLATYLAFGPVSIFGARLFGIPVTGEESKGMMHLWRYVGWLMGLDERWLAVSEGDGLRKLYHTFLTHHRPDEKIRLMGEALKNEPLSRPISGYENLPFLNRLRRYYLYHKHLSNSALILGLRNRYQLGLPLWILPWYPVLTAPLRFLKVIYYRLRGGTAFSSFLKRQREKQRQLLDDYFGSSEKKLITPDHTHPAHVDA